MGKNVFYRFVTATLCAEIIGFFWLVILPSKLSYGDYVSRLSYKNQPLYGLMDALVYKNDLPDNLAPSFHVLASFLPFIACCSKNAKGKHNPWMVMSSGIAFILIALSTLFVRQHYMADVFSSMLIVTVAYFAVCQ
jgi:membrane-associated phospholipid phosphatase